MKSIVTVAIMAVLSMFATIAFGQSHDRPDVHVGDRWDWQHINGMVNERDFTSIEDVIEVTGNEIRTRVRMKGRSGSPIMTYTRDWNPVDVVSARYAPYLKQLEFPLYVGKKWNFSADKMLFATGQHGVFTLKGEVVSLEKITVPAGTFEAYKIILTFNAVSTGIDAMSGTTTESFWYAPEVKQYVKRELTFSRDGRVRSKDILELLDYSLR